MNKPSNAFYVVALVVLCVSLILSGCKAKTKEDLLKEGINLLNTGDVSGAIILFKNSLEKDQNYFDARRQLAKAYLTAGKYEQSEKEFKKVLLMNPSQSDAYLDLSRSYLLSNRPDEALKETDNYLHVHPDSSEAFELLGHSYVLKNDLDQAEKSFLQALKLNPDAFSAKLGLAGVYMQRKDGQRAKELAEEVISKDKGNIKAYYLLARIEESAGDLEKALGIYRKITEMSPRESIALYKSGLLYIQKGQWDRAAEIADLLLKRFPQKPEGNTLTGSMYFHKKNFGDAIIAFQNSIKTKPTVEAYYFLGLSQYNKGELEQARSQFNKILAYDPSMVQARLMLGVIFLTQKRPDDAITEISKVLQNDGNNALAYNMLGSAYMAKGMYEEAMKELSSAILVDPTLIDAHLKKGAFDIATGNQKGAESELKTAVKVSPDLLNTRLILASYYVKHKDYSKAIATLKQGVTGKKTDAPLYNYIAIALFSEKKEVEAISFFEKAKETNPDYFAPYFNLAAYYSIRGDHEKELKEYNEVLKKDPKNVSALVNIALSFELRGRREDALAYYKKGKETMDPRGFFSLAGYFARKEDMKKAVEVLDEAVRAKIGVSEALSTKGKMYLSQKMYREAAATFEKLEAADPGKGFPLILSAYISARDYNGAMKRIEGKLKERPNDVEMRAQLAKIHILLKDPRKALENANMIIARQPGSAFGYTVLASVYESQNDLEAAQNTLKKGLQVDEKNVQALMMLGELYTKKKDYAHAINVYDDVVRNNPLYFQAVFAQGVTYDLRGMKREAVQKYREVCERSDGYVPALNNLAYLLLEGYGTKEEALELAIKANRIEPMNADVLDTLGYSLLKNGRKDESLSVLSRAAALRPENPSILYHIALAQEESGQRPLAIESVKKALQMGSFPDAKNADILLAKLKAGIDRRKK